MVQFQYQLNSSIIKGVHYLLKHFHIVLLAYLINSHFMLFYVSIFVCTKCKYTYELYMWFYTFHNAISCLRKQRNGKCIHSNFIVNELQKKFFYVQKMCVFKQKMFKITVCFWALPCVITIPVTTIDWNMMIWWYNKNYVSLQCVQQS